MSFQSLLDIELVSFGDFKLLVSHVFMVLLVLIAARLLLWLIRRALRKSVKEGRFAEGQMKAMYQIVSYIVGLVVVIVVLETLGVDLTVLVAGSAALLVGVGLGLQQLFLDVASGIILLFDKNVNIGDVIRIGDGSAGMSGRITHIGIRSTHILSTDNIITVVPNSKLTTSTLVNLTHSDIRTRFSVTVGVAYGSDVSKVKETLLSCAAGHELVEKDPEPYVFFREFGDSALLFELRFWCKDSFKIESVKSDLRYAIDTAFRKAGIEIPFPQRVVHMK